MMLLSVLCVIMALPAAALTAYPVGDMQYCMPYGETVEQTMFDYVHVYKPVDASITEAVIPESVTIGGKTFKVAEIRSSAFANCSSLASVTFPSSLTKIGNNAFQNCTALQSAVIPNSVIHRQQRIRRLQRTDTGDPAGVTCKDLQLHVLQLQVAYRH